MIGDIVFVGEDMGIFVKFDGVPEILKFSKTELQFV